MRKGEAETRDNLNDSIDDILDEIIRSLKAKNDKTITSLKAKNDETINSLKAENDKAITSLNMENDKIGTSLKVENDEIITSLKVENDKTVTSLKAENKALLVRLAAFKNTRRSSPSQIGTICDIPPSIAVQQAAHTTTVVLAAAPNTRLARRHSTIPEMRPVTMSLNSTSSLQTATFSSPLPVEGSVAPQKDTSVRPVISRTSDLASKRVESPDINAKTPHHTSENPTLDPESKSSSRSTPTTAPDVP